MLMYFYLYVNSFQENPLFLRLWRVNIGNDMASLTAFN
jgi:hypothetical protein